MTEFLQDQKVITDSERYDRQIRVWGAEAQSRLQNSKVLICGLQNLNIEVVKNLVLAGVNVTIQDDHTIVEGDYTNNFFLTEEAIGKNVVEAAFANIKALNNYVQLEHNTQPLSQLSDDFFLQFQVIVLAGNDEVQALRINHLCRKNSLNKKIIFFWNDTAGENSIFFSDFGEKFEYKEDPKTGSNSNTASSSSSTSEGNSDSNNKPAAVIKQISFPSLGTILNKKWNTIISRFFPLSKIFVQFRLLHSYRSRFGRNPTKDDLLSVKAVYNDLLTANNLNDPIFEGQTAYQEGLLKNDEDFFAICQSLHPHITYGIITTISVLGSVLTQEIIKAISLTGIPGFNVFVFEGANYSVKAIPIQ
eukprot:gene6331-6818_t